MQLVQTGGSESMRSPEAAFTKIGTLLVTASLILSPTQCTTEHASSRATVTDSSGVQIIVSTGPSWPDGSGWRLGEQPTFNIGVLEGEPDYQLFDVAGALRLADGRIVIAENGASELRFYDSRGRHLSSTGRAGGGPGEFGTITSMSATPGDTMVVLDSRNRRISYFGPSGTFSHSVPLPFLAEMGGFPVFAAPFDDGTVFLVVRDYFGSGGLGAGLTSGELVYVRCRASGALMDTLAVRPGTELYSAVQGENRLGGVRPFGLSSQYAFHRNGFFHGSGDSYEIEHLNQEGDLRRFIRRPIANMEVTEADLEGYKGEWIEKAADETQRAINETLVEAIPFPEAFPAYRRLIVDADGNLWVEAYRKPGDNQPRWTVFDRAGQMLGEVRTPEGFTVFQIVENFVLGRWEDEFDVQHVVMYPLLKE